MPKFRITGPDGASYDINAPEGATQDQVLAYAQQNLGQQPAKPASDIKAPTSGLAMGLRDPVDAGAQMLRRVVGDKIGGAVDTFGNWLADKGLPVAKSSGVEGVDRIVNDVNAGYEASRKAAAGGEDPGFDGKRLVGNMLNPVNYVGGGAAGTGLKALALAGAKAGVVSGVMQPVVGADDQQDFWANKGGQAVAGAAGGAVLNPAVAKGAEKLVEAATPLLRRGAVPVTDRTINIAVNNTFSTQGMNPAEVPEAVLQSVRRQVDEAMRAGQRLNPQEMLRRARFEAVGLTDGAAPTAGQLSRNPMQWANEKDLSGVRIRTPQGEGNPLADRFSAQNRRLQEVFDQAGAQDAIPDRATAGQTMINALRQSDEPVRGHVDDLYTAARGMNEGRAWDLERGHFTTNASRELDQGMWGAFLPPEVRTLFNSISEGKTPFNVDAAVQIDTLLSKAQRKAERAGDDAGASAVGVIRRHLHGTPLTQAETGAARAAGDTVEGMTRNVTDGIDDVVPRMPQRPALQAPASTAVAVPRGGAVGPQMVQPPRAAQMNPGEAARAAFDQARRAARDRFATIEAAPALRAALDEAAPDKFVQNFILNADGRDVQAMRQVLANSPDALGQARAQIADHLKRAAFGENLSGDKVFSPERYNKTLRAMGREKLEAFFTPAEIVRMNLAAQVASDINSVPAGAKPNFSNTGSTVLNLLSKLSESGPLRQIPGVRAIANQVGEIKTERAINQALSPQPAAPQAELPPEMRRALQFFFSPAGVAGGVLGGAAVN